MTTTAPIRPAAARTNPATGMRVLGKVTVTEATLYLRQPAAVFFGLLFPTLLLLGLGLLMPWADEPFDAANPVLAQVTAITAYTPIVLALAIGTVAYTTLPPTMGGYRETGVLRRLATTPVPPSRLLVAQVVVNLGMLVVASALAVAGGAFILGIEMPVHVGITLLAFLLAAAASMAVGTLLAAVVPTAGAGTGAGMAVYMTSLFFAGVWFPLPLLPDAVQAVSRVTPLGAASQALAAGWYEGRFPAVELLVLAAWTVVVIPFAAKLFRWT